MATTSNGTAMDMNIVNERVKRGVWERWRIRSNQGAHPFHVHGCSFLIEQMEGAATSPDQQGWKDMVVLVPLRSRLTETLFPIKIAAPNTPVFLNSEGEPYRDISTEAYIRLSLGDAGHGLHNGERADGA